VVEEVAPEATRGTARGKPAMEAEEAGVAGVAGAERGMGRERGAKDAVPTLASSLYT